MSHQNDSNQPFIPSYNDPLPPVNAPAYNDPLPRAATPLSNGDPYGNSISAPSVSPDDAPNFLWAVVGFAIPLAGLIMYLSNNTKTPQKARSALRGAGVSLGVSMVMILGIVILAVTAGSRRASATLFPAGPVNDVQFAQTTFQHLANGDLTAENHVDWEHMQLQQKNVGASYVSMHSAQERSGFRIGFVRSFSQSLQRLGVTSDSLVNWRVQTNSPPYVMVAADGARGRKIYLNVLKTDGVQKIASIEIQ